ncbi:TPA: hypothetical protein DCX30_03030 [Candidatus Beckwithbacteria bacterium]|nr:hypothetical protein [Candidatus Beckwithbacteria bacterium]
MRSVINISLPQQLASVVDQAVDTGKYASKSEFFRSLLRTWIEDRLARDLDKSRLEMKQTGGKLLKSLRDLR